MESTQELSPATSNTHSRVDSWFADHQIAIIVLHYRCADREDGGKNWLLPRKFLLSDFASGQFMWAASGIQLCHGPTQFNQQSKKHSCWYTQVALSCNFKVHMCDHWHNQNLFCELTLSFQNKVQKKYVSIKVFPKGSNLSKKAITHQIAFEGLRQ